MSTSLLPLLTALATIVAAFLAAVIALINMLNSKDQKTTEFRQAWINELRQQISDFSAQARWISAAVEQAKRFDPNCFSRDSKAYETYSANRQLINTAYYSICLHFKPGDSDFTALDAQMKDVLHQLAHPSKLKFDSVTARLDEIVETAKKILKTEWTRVKSGEFTYRMTKYSAMVIIVASIVGGCILVQRLPSVLDEVQRTPPSSTSPIGSIGATSAASAAVMPASSGH